MNDQAENNLPQVTQGFQRRFDSICARLLLAEHMGGEELGFLCVAAFYAMLCNIAFNGLGGCQGEIKPERELHRIGLERGFMTARDRVYGADGWKNAPEFTRISADRLLLRVSVLEDNLA
jgi:hypothetical protein